MTPLQQAVKNLLDRWNSPIDWPEHYELRKALEDELHVPEIGFGNIVEPVGYFYFVKDEEVWKQAGDMQFKAAYTPLYLHPPQQAVTSGERAELIADCRSYAKNGASFDARRLARLCADMLESDAQQAKPKTMGEVQEMCIAALQRDERAKVGDSRFESWYSELNQAGKGNKQIVREAYEAGLNEADAQQMSNILARIHRDGGHYESEYGRGKAINTADLIVAKLNAMEDAQQAKQVPMTPQEITEMATQEQFLLVCDGLEELTQIVRSTEQHHGIHAPK